VLSPKYAFITAFLKGEEAKSVTPEHIDKMTAVSNLQDALAVIRETDVGSYLEESLVKVFDDLDKHLWHYLSQRIRYITSFKLIPKDVLKLCRAYVVKYDILNIKAALQGIATGKKASMVPVGIIHDNGLVDELSATENLDEIIQLLVKSRLRDYVPALEQYKTDGGVKSTFVLQAKLDSQYYESMLSVSRTISDGHVLARIIGIAIDLTNLEIVMRSLIDGTKADISEYTIAGGYMLTGQGIKNLSSSELAEVPTKLWDTPYQDIAKEVLSSYEMTKNISAVSEVIDKHKFRLTKELLATRILSSLVVAWYLIIKEIEIRNLRLVLKSIIDGISVQEIKNYLVF